MCAVFTWWINLDYFVIICHSQVVDLNLIDYHFGSTGELTKDASAPINVTVGNILL